MFLIRECGTSNCGVGVKCDKTSVVANESRGFVTGAAFHGYCVSGNLPEMPYPLTELVKASRRWRLVGFVDVWQVVQIAFSPGNLLIVIMVFGHFFRAVTKLFFG